MQDPALQQIPARDVEMAEIVRSAFIAEKRQKWLCADWKQFEFRWFAHYVNDPQLNKAYYDDPETDFHQIVANLTGLPRKPRFAGDPNAKQINLGLVFGMGEGTMAMEMGLPYEMGDSGYAIAGPEAKKIFAQYHAAIPGVRSLLQKASGVARSRGHVMTAMERHLHFPGKKFVHKAGGLVFQGTSADCAKLKMIELYHNGHKQGDYRLLLSVHDEFDFSIDPRNTTKIAEIKKRLETFDGVECPIECRIPILSDVSIASNWYEASKE
jgi:DNA polymerase-1